MSLRWKTIITPLECSNHRSEIQTKSRAYFSRNKNKAPIGYSRSKPICSIALFQTRKIFHRKTPRFRFSTSSRCNKQTSRANTTPLGICTPISPKKYSWIAFESQTQIHNWENQPKYPPLLPRPLTNSKQLNNIAL